MEQGSKVKKIIKRTLAVFVIFFAIIGMASSCAIVSVAGNSKELITAYYAYQLIYSSYYKAVDKDILFEGLTSGLADSVGDPYTTYYNKAELIELNRELDGKYAGVGMLLGYEKDTKLVKVYRVFKDSPAAKAGIKSGDIIFEINGKSAENLTVEDVSLNAKGEIGTSVDLVVYREGELLSFSLVRAEITAPSVSARFLDSSEDILYIEITTFSEKTGQELDDIFNSLDRKPEGVVLDLRDNGGGLVSQALEAAKYFVPGGVIYYETGRDIINLKEYAVPGNRYCGVPIAVLVNSNTASASEILAGAIQDHGTGKLVGSNTFGKAVVQQIFPMPTGGAIKLTTKRYLTPDRRDLSKDGLTPDYEYIPTIEEIKKIDFSKQPDEENDINLQKALEILGI